DGAIGHGGEGDRAYALPARVRHQARCDPRRIFSSRVLRPGARAVFRSVPARSGTSRASSRGLAGARTPPALWLQRGGAALVLAGDADGTGGWANHIADPLQSRTPAQQAPAPRQGVVLPVFAQGRRSDPVQW